MVHHVCDLMEAMESMAPTALAQEWDNVGLLIGSTHQTLSKVMVTIDLTEAVVHEAIESGVDGIVSYHPIMFQGLKSITTRTPEESLVLEIIRAGMAVYSPHTAMDAVVGGVNDWLLTGVGRGQAQAIEPIVTQDPSQACKVTTFVPAQSVEDVRKAIAAAGGGRIGEYTNCSFSISGTGTFLGSESTTPRTGVPGVLEHVDEFRLEMVCGQEDVEAVVAAIDHVHPYEEPAVDIVAMEPVTHSPIGSGRRMVLEDPLTLGEIADSLKSHLGIDTLRCAAAGDLDETVKVVGCCVGAGGSMVDPAIAAGCDLFITGEMRHHDVLSAIACGCSVLLAGHTNTERGFLPILAQRLCEALPEVEVVIAASDTTPWTVL